VDSTQNVISFCTGYGGLDIGLKRVWPDCRTIAYVEIEAFAITNLVAKMEQGKLDSAPIWTDIKTFDGRPFRGKVHGFTAGYPCQPFSVAGKRRGKEDPRHLWPYLEEHIRTIRPLWCWFENVGGHLTIGFDEVFKSLRDLGYKVEAGLFTASEVGAPHKRERLFILAYNDDSECRTRAVQNRVDKRPIQEGQRDNRRSLRVEVAGRGDQLAIPQSQRCGETGSDSGRCSERTAIASELADTTSQRIQGHEPKGSSQPERQIDQLRNNRWPARPGQEQYDWEEPRTVESGMGRTIDGFKSRVDELRLLGNGVVPEQAELALRILLGKIAE